MRIDKFIWAIRLFKTRSTAQAACNADKVQLNGQTVKPSKTVGIGDEIQVRQTPIWRSYKILQIPKSRVGAKLVPTLVIEQTSQEDLKQLEVVNEMNRKNRFMGIKGRPTKKDQRDINRFKDSFDD